MNGQPQMAQNRFPLPGVQYGVQQVGGCGGELHPVLSCVRACIVV